MLMGQIADSTGAPVLVLSITDDDVRRLKDGQPLYCHTEPLPGLPAVDVAVTYGPEARDAAVAIAAAVPAGYRFQRMGSSVCVSAPEPPR